MCNKIYVKQMQIEIYESYIYCKGVRTRNTPKERILLSQVKKKKSTSTDTWSK